MNNNINNNKALINQSLTLMGLGEIMKPNILYAIALDNNKASIKDQETAMSIVDSFLDKVAEEPALPPAELKGILEERDKTKEEIKDLDRKKRIVRLHSFGVYLTDVNLKLLKEFGKQLASPVGANLTDSDLAYFKEMHKISDHIKDNNRDRNDSWMLERVKEKETKNGMDDLQKLVKNEGNDSRFAKIISKMDRNSIYTIPFIGYFASGFTKIGRDYEFPRIEATDHDTFRRQRFNEGIHEGLNAVFNIDESRPLHTFTIGTGPMQR